MKAFRMHLKPGCKEEYKRRHSELWPEMREAMKKEGVYDYSIWLDEETGYLFAFQRTKGEGGSQDMKSDVVLRWWHYMEPLMDCNPDESPVTVPLEMMFYQA